MNIAIGALAVRPFTVPHDAREPLQLRARDGARRLGVLTDLGHATPHVLEQLAGCATLLLECNHDRDMLAGIDLSGLPQAARRRRLGSSRQRRGSRDRAQRARTAACKQVVAAH